MSVAVGILLFALVVYGLSFWNLYRARRNLDRAMRVLEQALLLGETVESALRLAALSGSTDNGERVY